MRVIDFSDGFTSGSSPSISPLTGSATSLGLGDGASGSYIYNATTSSKTVYFDLSGATASTKTTLTFSQTANRVITFPDASVTLASLTGTETLTNKTLTTPTIDIPLMSQQTTPSNPASGYYKVYFKSDGSMYTLNSSGVESAVSTSSNTQSDQSYEVSNLSLACSVASNALTIAVKGSDGNDPSGSNVVYVSFRNTTASTGDYTRVTLTSALSMTVSSGSTLGHKDATETFIYVFLINNAGTMELAVSSSYFDDGKLKSSTAEGGAGAADSISGFYSTTARTSKAIRCVGRLRSTQTTAGTWAAVPTEVSLIPFMWKEVSPFTDALVILPNSSAFGTVTGNDYRTRRVGDCLEVVGFFTSGTLGANPAKIGLPTGLTIDTAKCFTNKATLVGHYHAVDDATSNGFFSGTHTSGVCYIETGDTSNVYMTSTGNGGTFESANGTTLGANGDSFMYRFTVPITEWTQ